MPADGDSGVATLAAVSVSASDAPSRVVRRYTGVLDEGDAAIVALHEDAPEPLDLTSEIALARSILSSYLAENGFAKPFQASRLLESVTRTVETQSKIDAANSLTVAQVLRLMSEMGQALERAVMLTVSSPLERSRVLAEVREAWRSIKV